MNSLDGIAVNDMNAEDVVRNYFGDAAILVCYDAQEILGLPVLEFDIGKQDAQVRYLIGNFIRCLFFITHATSVLEGPILY
jgi:hypothetical protein